MNENIKSAVATLDGATYRDMIVSAAFALDNDKDDINNLNVFPVPDGDTGINMSLTMSPARQDLPSFNGTVSEVAAEVAKTFLRAARGNSGVILSSFFRGMSRGMKDMAEADIPSLAAGFASGVDMAYKAVMKPTEGTILTVMRVGSEAVNARLDTITTMDELFTVMLEASEKTLAETPEMLPQLKQANVVDAGGCGFVTVLRGMLSALRGEPVQPKDPASVSTVNKQADFSQFDTEAITFPYCTECIVTK